MYRIKTESQQEKRGTAAELKNYVLKLLVSPPGYTRATRIALTVFLPLIRKVNIKSSCTLSALVISLP
jgi:hypothetical protein